MVDLKQGKCELSTNTYALFLKCVAEYLSLDEMLESLPDYRCANKIIHSIPKIVFLKILLLAKQFKNQSDVNTLKGDLIFKYCISNKILIKALMEVFPHQATISRVLSYIHPIYLMKILLDIAIISLLKARNRNEKQIEQLIIDVDSFPLKVHGKQEKSEYNAHYHEYCYHPIIAIAESGQILGIQLREGKCHTSNGIINFLKPIIEKLKPIVKHLIVRVDAGFHSSEVFNYLHKQNVDCLVRLKSYANLKQMSAKWEFEITQKWNREPNTSSQQRTAFLKLDYHNKTWDEKFDVYAVLVENPTHHNQCVLFHNRFYLLSLKGNFKENELLTVYRQRGNAENYIGEFVNEVPISCSSHYFQTNQVNCQLSALAFNLVHTFREFMAKEVNKGISIKTLKKQLSGIVAVVTKQSRKLVVKISNLKPKEWDIYNRILKLLNRTEMEAMI